jgi:hypothetical protein
VFRNRDPEPMRADRLPTICASRVATSSASRPRVPSAPAMRPRARPRGAP